MKKLICVILTLIFICELQGQTLDTLNQSINPQGGVQALALEYYGIKFSKEQRDRVDGIELEFIYDVDEKGSPVLQIINGVSDLDLIDSFKMKTLELKNFQPRIVDGIPIPAIYFMKFSFPKYNTLSRQQGFLQASTYHEAEFSDFEYIEESSHRFDMIAGGSFISFLGRPSSYHNIGGGALINMDYTRKNKLNYGFNLGIYGSRLKKEFPVNTPRKQINPLTGLMGFQIGRWINNFNIQGQLNFVVQNLTRKVGEDDPDWVQLGGWSPGIVVHYPIEFGGKKTQYYYGRPTILIHHMNFHCGLRYLDFSLKEASGMMFEFGLSYRMTSQGILYYKFKDEFLSQ